MSFHCKRRFSRPPSIPLDDAAWCVCAVVLVVLILLDSVREFSNSVLISDPPANGIQLLQRPCDEIYLVGEGETLHTIIDKCGDPYIVEQNPHIHDPDDIFPGIVIKITPSKQRMKLPLPR